MVGWKPHQYIVLFPEIGLLNRFHLGDSVILEPIARQLSELIERKIIVFSEYPQLFEFNPYAIGARFKELTPEQRVIDFADVLTINNGEVPHDRLKKLYGKVGLEYTSESPMIYLSVAEEWFANAFKKCFSGKCLGVVLRSSNSAKDWAHTELFIKAARKHYNVFLIGDTYTPEVSDLLKTGCYSIISLPIRDAIAKIKALDVVVGPDTGITHVAAALGIPTIVIVLEQFAELYEPYKNVHQFIGHLSVLYGLKQRWQRSNSSIKIMLSSVLPWRTQGITTVSPYAVLKAVDEIQVNTDNLPLTIAIVRYRGIGDVLLSLPAVATLKKLGTVIHYYTSPACTQLLQYSSVIDKVIPIDYNHATSGLPTLPPEYDFSGYSVVYNMINQVDFCVESQKMPRTELFGYKMGIEEIDYSADWRLHLPEEVNSVAKDILKEHGITETDKTIAFQVDSKGLSRQWQKIRQIEFIQLAVEEEYKVILLSDIPHSGYPEGVVNLTGKLKLMEFVGIINVSSLFVGLDSSGIHIAGALGRPAIGLFGSVDPGLRVSHYDTVSIIQGIASCVPCNDWQLGNCANDEYVPYCMWNIKAKTVFEKCQEKEVKC